MLKPSKCKFVRQELEYLGHTVSREGLKTSPRLVEAVDLFPVPQTVQETRRFLGLASYYRRFIHNFARIALALHDLTCKGVPFHWGAEQEGAFVELKKRLTTAPVLAYPDFKLDFYMETDASVLGLGVVLCQFQADQKLHPIAYASRALNAAEKKYAVTELETLTVVWGCPISITIYTGTPSPYSRTTQPSGQFWNLTTQWLNTPDGGPRCMAGDRRVCPSSTGQARRTRMRMPSPVHQFFLHQRWA